MTDQQSAPVDAVVLRPCPPNGKKFMPGDPPPEGYNAWHEWAGVQHRAGLRQRQCGKCSLWKFPQEMGSQVIKATMINNRGKAQLVSSLVCIKCEAKQ